MCCSVSLRDVKMMLLATHPKYKSSWTSKFFFSEFILFRINLIFSFSLYSRYISSEQNLERWEMHSSIHHPPSSQCTVTFYTRTNIPTGSLEWLIIPLSCVGGSRIGRRHGKNMQMCIVTPKEPVMPVVIKTSPFEFHVETENDHEQKNLLIKMYGQIVKTFKLNTATFWKERAVMCSISDSVKCLG